MKKSVLIAIIFTIIIVVYLSIGAINIFNFRHNKKPFLYVKQNYIDNGSDYVEQYCSIGYEMVNIKYNGVLNKYLYLGCSDINKYVTENSKKIVYEPIDNDKSCKYEKTKLYQDEDRIFYLKCYSSNYLYYYDDENNKETVREALLHSHILLGDLKRAGYEIIIEDR